MDRRMEMEWLKGHEDYPFHKNVARFGQSIMSRQGDVSARNDFLKKYSTAFQYRKAYPESGIWSEYSRVSQRNGNEIKRFCYNSNKKSISYTNGILMIVDEFREPRFRTRYSFTSVNKAGSVGRSSGRLVGRWVNLSIGWSVDGLICRSVGQLFHRWVSWTVCFPIVPTPKQNAWNQSR